MSPRICGLLWERGAETWAEVFVREVGTRDEFFSLGGDSLRAAQILARIGKISASVSRSGTFSPLPAWSISPGYSKRKGPPRHPAVRRATLATSWEILPATKFYQSILIASSARYIWRSIKEVKSASELIAALYLSRDFVSKATLNPDRMYLMPYLDSLDFSRKFSTLSKNLNTASISLKSRCLNRGLNGLSYLVRTKGIAPIASK